MRISELGLPRLSEATGIRILDSWNGLSPFAPVTIRYELKNGSAGFTGQGNFSVGYPPTGTVETVTLPVGAAGKFFSTLDDPAMPVQEGTYEPLITHTDDYPSLIIHLDFSGGEKVTYFSNSQGAGHVPWGLTYKDKTYIVNSPIPSYALDTLWPYLKREVVIDRLEQQIIDRMKSPTP
jgi:hypothetical protein